MSDSDESDGSEYTPTTARSESEGANKADQNDDDDEEQTSGDEEGTDDHSRGRGMHFKLDRQMLI